MAPDEPVVVVLGVQDPSQYELVLIGEAHAARRLSLDSSQDGNQKTHQQGDNRDDDQQFNEGETASSVHHGISHRNILTAIRRCNQSITPAASVAKAGK